MKFKNNDMMTMIIINKERIFYKKKYVCLLLILLNDDINISYTNTFYAQSMYNFTFVYYIPIQSTDDTIVKCLNTTLVIYNNIYI